MAPKTIQSKEDFAAAIAEPTKFVSIYIHEGAITDEERKRFEDDAPKYADKIEHYTMDIAGTEAKEKMSITKVPTLLMYKEGKEVARVEGPNEENTKELAKLFA